MPLPIYYLPLSNPKLSGLFHLTLPKILGHLHIVQATIPTFPMRPYMISASFFLQTWQKTWQKRPLSFLSLLGPRSSTYTLLPAIGPWFSLLTNQGPIVEQDLNIRTHPPFRIISLFSSFRMLLSVGFKNSFYYVEACSL